MDTYENALKRIERDKACKEAYMNAAIVGPTGPTGPTARLVNSSNK